MTWRAQLALVGTLCLTAFAGFAGLGWLHIIDSERAANRIETVLLPEISVLEEMRSAALAVFASTNEIILIHITNNYIDHLERHSEMPENTSAETMATGANAEDEDGKTLEIEQVADGRKQFLKAYRDFVDIVGPDPVVKAIQREWIYTWMVSQDIIQNIEDTVEMAEIEILRETLEGREIAMMALLGDVIRQTTAANYKSLDEATGTVRESAHYFSLVTFVGLLTLIGFALFTVRSLRRQEALLDDLRAESEKTAKALEDAETARNEAIRLSQTKSEFLAMMSHEIRTPMNGVIGMLELLKDTNPTAEQENYFEIIDASATALLTVINDILDLTRIQAGRIEIKPEPVDIGSLVHSVTDLVRAAVLNKGITLTVEIDPAVPHRPQLDPVRMRQVLTNIVGNAAKFTCQGSIDVSVWSANCKTIDGPVLFFAIKDTGPGIEPDMLREIFDPFTQSDSSLSRKHEGTGLGLSIAKGLIDSMHGQISVTSTPGVGSTFTLFVPLVSDATQAPPVPPLDTPNGAPAPKSNTPGIAPDHAATPGTTEPPKPKAHVNVLAVDDNPTNLLVAEKLVASMGYSVETAESGQEALDLVKQTNFDLILMDLQMPDMDGFQAMAAIRRELADSTPFRPMPPVVAMTAHASRIFAEESRERGMADHLSKPLTKSVLASCLDRYLGTPNR
ncbi:response regulator [Hwanghaeella grinnelliae]|uniref:Sensory/regulatory protein RpfC n=1 Tax=Hwanghaeella grinnelliae TaxID=2500179 RepID=A0A3S2W6F9_9PROT|nr:ATP-binding protein [Hwanghaeella grinnelliae]RVU38367.1 response regulator [Hwanghaeella grinnelliae]